MSEMQTSTDGSNIAPTPESACPVASSGQSLAATTSTEITVTPGVYVLTCTVGYCVVGNLTTATAANILYVAQAGGPSCNIYVPAGGTSIWYKLVGTSPLAWLRKVSE